MNASLHSLDGPGSFLVPNQKACRLRTAGVTLVEVMIALGILAMLSVGVMAVTLQLRKMAELGVYQNTALSLAQGYMEQVRHLDFNTLNRVAKDGGTPKTVVLPLNQTTGVAFSNCVNGSWNVETIYLDENSKGAPNQPIVFRFQAVLTSLELSSAAQGVEVTINYQVRENFGATNLISGALRSVRSAVPSY